MPPIDRPKNVKRALLLGDSVPFSGWGCREGGAPRRTLELRTGEEWNVINTGTPAGFSSMALATLAHEGMQFKPDIVVSFNGANGGRQVSQRLGALHQDWISKGHSGFPSWNEKVYLANNPDVAKAVAAGEFTWVHYLQAGRAEGRLEGLPPRWVEKSYLDRHGDVLQAIQRGEFNSGLDH